MAACIVCNQQALHQNVQDVGDMAKLRSRLEKVLEETVPENCMMCASCQFDLAQIEMYYALLTVFKRRYSETTKQRLQNAAGDTSRNLLHKTVDSPSQNLQNMFSSVDISRHTDSLPMPGSIGVEGNSDITTGHIGIVNVRSVREEFLDDTSTNNTDYIMPALDEIPQTATLADPSPVVALHKLETQNDSISTDSLMVSPRKRGRPRKSEQMGVVTKSSIPKMKKAQKKVPGKTVSSAVTDPAQVNTNVGEESEVLDHVEVKVEVPDAIVASTSQDAAATGDGKAGVSKVKQRKPKKDKDPSYAPGVNRKKEKKPRKSKKDPKYKSGADERKETQREPEQDEDQAHVPGPQTPGISRKAGRPRKDDPKPPFTCPVCNKVFNERSSFTTHSKRHTDERPHVCAECGKAFKDSGGLRQHKLTHTLGKDFKCTECSRAFISKRALNRHSLVHTDSRPFPCDQCEKWFKSEERLRCHIKLEHVQGRKFLCNICGLATYTVGNLRVHLLTHSEVKPFQCQTCGKRCSTKLTLRNHEYTHTEEGPPRHLCPVCGKLFSNKSHLIPHIKLHSGASKHHCTICDKYYATGHLYRRHMQIHQDQKPHQCTECGKGFSTPENLKQHMTTHSDKRQFKCPCGSSFRQKDKLKKHLGSKIHVQYELAVTQRANSSSLANPNTSVAPAAMPVGLSAPVIAAVDPTASAMYSDVPATLGTPVGVETQQERHINMADDEGRTAPMYLVMYEEEEIVEHSL